MYLQVRRAEFSAYMYKAVLSKVSLDGQIDGMKFLQLLAGVLVETLLLFDDPDDGLEASYDKLASMLACEPVSGVLGKGALPPAYMIDQETEAGRELAKGLFEEWLTCAYEFHDMVLFFVHSVIMRLEQARQPRAEIFRLFIESANRCMAYEIAAQELCDIVIDRKIARHGWSLSESVSGLCAVAGRNLAMSITGKGREILLAGQEVLDNIAYVMTQEAIRLGIPAGTDWRFGLAANDCVVSAPFSLINGLDPHCHEFFVLIGMHDLTDQAVATAKAAGRMLAIAAGGETPEIEPVIAKPLAMAAMTDTYKTVCRDRLALSL